MDWKTVVATGRKLAKSDEARTLRRAARVVVQNGPVKEIAKLCGRAGVAGAVVDGSMGGVQAIKALREGRLDGAGAAKHVAAEAGCGFVTSSAGTAGTVAVYLVTGTMGPTALVLGMGASMGSRWAYRKFVGETLPPEGAAVEEPPVQDEEVSTKEEDVDEDVAFGIQVEKEVFAESDFKPKNGFEEIGPEEE